MQQLLHWYEQFFERIPLAFLEVWGRFSYLIGVAAMLLAFLGMTFRMGGKWQFGRQSQHWESRALLAFALTFFTVIATGYFGSSVVLVPQAQTFETLKDLSVFVCIVLFGYPALLSVPIAYGISDLIEGVPPVYISDWLVGYFINPALFWVGAQILGRDPDFRKASTWRSYAGSVALFLCLEPVLWGYLCSNVFPVEISYRKILPALAYTTSLTWLLAPFALLAAYPLAKRYGMYWPKIPDFVTEYTLRPPVKVWTSGRGSREGTPKGQDIPLQMFFSGPALLVVVLMVGFTAFGTLRSAETSVKMLAGRLQQESSENLTSRLNQFLEKVPGGNEEARRIGIDRILQRNGTIGGGRAFLIDRLGRVVGTSNGNRADPVAREAIRMLRKREPALPGLALPTQFELDLYDDQPVRQERWLALATPYSGPTGAISGWTLLTATPQSFYLSGVYSGTSRSAMAFAVFLALSLLATTLLARRLIRPISLLADSAESIARGNLDQSAPPSRIEEVRRLSDSFNHMSRELKRTDRQLRLAKEEAESSSRIKSEFLDIAAHELRTPMTPLLLLVQLVQEQVRAKKPVSGAQIEQIARQVRRLGALIDELLNLSRLERGGFDLKPAWTPLRTLLSDLVGDFRRLEPGREIRLELWPESLEAEIDAVRIHQVIQNLLENARKYTPAGTPVEVIAWQEGERLRVCVTDHGPGIPEDEQAQLFTRFFRAQTDARLKQPGLGLGLYICRKIIEMHGGWIRLRGTQPTGCTFEFEIPIRRSAEHVQTEHHLAG